MTWKLLRLDWCRKRTEKCFCHTTVQLQARCPSRLLEGVGRSVELLSGPESLPLASRLVGARKCSPLAVLPMNVPRLRSCQWMFPACGLANECGPFDLSRYRFEPSPRDSYKRGPLGRKPLAVFPEWCETITLKLPQTVISKITPFLHHFVLLPFLSFEEHLRLIDENSFRKYAIQVSFLLSLTDGLSLSKQTKRTSQRTLWDQAVDG